LVVVGAKRKEEEEGEGKAVAIHPNKTLGRRR
jgi:hypothetical protein